MGNGITGKSPCERTALVIFVLFLGGLLLTWVAHGTGVIKNDPQNNIYIPAQLTMPLRVQAAYNDTDIFFRYHWPAEYPGFLHDVLVYQDGKWSAKGGGMPWSDPDGLAEDRVAMMLDDGSVPEFARYGGYYVIGSGMAGFSDHADKKAVTAHPYLGEKKKLSEITKHLPQTRTDMNDWRTVQSEQVLQAQRAAGYFIDLWHWRANRSNPVNMSDDQFAAEARYTDQGTSVVATNWDGKAKLPRYMFNSAVTGYKALKWDDVAGKKLTQDSAYFLTADDAVAFDPNAGWTDGDVLPRRFLRTPKGSAGDIAVQGRGYWENGYWDVELKRKLDTGHPLDDKILEDQGAYAAAFAVHRDANAGRWHYVSLPVSLGLGRDAALMAQKFAGDTPKWNDAWFEITLFYPGQINWPHLNSKHHAGSDSIRLGQPAVAHHTPEQLAHYGVEAEFSGTIGKQWLLTLLAGIALLAGMGIGLVAACGRKEKRNQP